MSFSRLLLACLVHVSCSRTVERELGVRRETRTSDGVRHALEAHQGDRSLLSSPEGTGSSSQILALFFLAFNPAASWSLGYTRPFSSALARNRRGYVSPGSAHVCNRRADISLSKSQVEESQPLKKPLLPNGPTLDATFVAILIVYFVQGALGLASLTSSFFLKDELGLSPGDLAALSGLFVTPWVIKPIYGFTTDNFPIFGLRRRPYLIASGLCGALGFGALATVVSTPQQALAASITYNLGIAFSDVVVDSICVEKARDEAIAKSDGITDSEVKDTMEREAAATLQSWCWGSRYVGGIVAALVSGPLLEQFAPRTVYGATALFPLLVALAGFIATESSVQGEDAGLLVAKSQGDSEDSVADKFKEKAIELFNTVKQREIILPLLVVALFLATPSSGTAWFYYLTNSMGLGPTQLGRLKLLDAISSLVGVLLYRTVFAQSRASTVIGFATLLSVPLGLLQLLLVTHQNQALGIPDDWLIYGDDVFLSALGQLAFMPVLTFAAQVCPAGQEGTFFALLMSAYNSAGIFGSEVSGVLTDKLGVTAENFAMLPMLIVICNLASLLPLPLLGLLDKDDEGEAEKAA